MRILTDDISKIETCLVGDLYKVEINNLTEQDYNLDYTSAYGNLDPTHALKNPFKSFEDSIWAGEKNDDALRSEIELMKMPKKPKSIIKDCIGREVLNLLEQKLTSRFKLRYCWWVQRGIINAAVVYTSNSSPIFTTQIVQVTLTAL